MKPCDDHSQLAKELGHRQDPAVSGCEQSSRHFEDEGLQGGGPFVTGGVQNSFGKSGVQKVYRLIPTPGKTIRRDFMQQFCCSLPGLTALLLHLPGQVPILQNVWQDYLPDVFSWQSVVLPTPFQTFLKRLCSPGCTRL